jgi:hypothetical protein
VRFGRVLGRFSQDRRAFEEWRSRGDVAWIDGSDSDDSLPLLIDGSDLDEQDLDDHQIELDAAGLIHNPKDTVVYGGIPFGVALGPSELLRQREEFETHLNREAFGFCWVVHPQIASVIYRGCSYILGLYLIAWR